MSIFAEDRQCQRPRRPRGFLTITPIGPAADALVLAAVTALEAVVAALGVAVAGLKAIGWELVILGFATGRAPGGITFTFTNGGLEFAHAKAWPLVSKNLSITTALRSGMVRPNRRAALRFWTAGPVSTADKAVPSGRTTRLP